MNQAAPERDRSSSDIPAANFVSKPGRISAGAGLSWIVAVAVIVIAVGLRVHQLGEVNYWFDETFSMRMSEFPIPEMVQRCAADTHPPLFFLGLKPWITAFGTSTLAVRAFSLLWSVATVIAASCFVLEALEPIDLAASHRGRGLFAAALSGILLALSPLQLTWAHQVRMYSMAGFFAVLCTWFLWRALAKPQARLRWWMLGIAEICGVYTHVTMIFVVALHCALLGIVAILPILNGCQDVRRQLRSRAIMTCICIAAAAVPWFIVVRSQHARVKADFWSEPFEWSILGDAILRCLGNPEGTQPDPSVGYWIGQGIVVVLLLVAAGRKRFDVLLSLTAAAPFAGVILISLFSRNILNARYFISGQTLLLVAVAVLISRLPSRWLRIPVAVIVVGGQLFLVQSYFDWRTEAASKPGIPGLLQTWKDHRTENEPLVFCNPMFYTTSRVYQGNSDDFMVFGDGSSHPFFVGTAIMSDDEYVSADDLDSSGLQTVWTCDFGWSSRFLQPVPMSHAWKLATEKNVLEFNGSFFLRRYDRITPPSGSQE